MDKYIEKPIPKIINTEKLPIKIDYKLLFSLLKQQAPSYSIEQDLKCLWIRIWVLANIPEVKITFDDYGNLYITKGQTEIYPCMVAHLDIVHEVRPGFDVLKTDNIIYGFDMLTGTQAGVGGDDNCGLYICLEMLRLLPHLKVVFTKDEEVGMVGARKVNVDFFKNCSFLAQPDRRSTTTDFINHTNGREVCDASFYQLFQEELDLFGYNCNTGTATDIGTIKGLVGIEVPAFNFSNGSYREHMQDEIILIDHLKNALNFIYNVIIKVGHMKFHHISPVPKYTYTHYDDKYDDWYDEFLKKEQTWETLYLEHNQCPTCLVQLEANTKIPNLYTCPSCEKKYNKPKNNASTRNRRFNKR